MDAPLHTLLMRQVSDGVLLADADGRVQEANPAATRIFGREVAGRLLQELIDPWPGASGPLPTEAFGLRAGGARIPLELSVTAIAHAGRELRALVLRDVSERHALYAAAQESEARFASTFNDAASGMALIGPDGRWLQVNATLCRMLGYRADELMALRFQDLTHADDLVIDETFVQLVLADQLTTYQMETRYFHKEGQTVPVLLSSTLVRDAQGQPLYFIAKIDDLTQRRRVEDALYAEKDLAQTTLQSIGDAVVTTDAHGFVNYLNPMAERMTGWSMRAAFGRPAAEVLQLVHEESRKPAADPFAQALAEGKTGTLAHDTVLIARDGGEYFIDHSAAPIHLRDGSLSGAVMVFRDVSEQRMLSRKISFQASHDALTGLFNRSEFELTATQLLQSARILSREHALLYLDLDQFKIVNDTCGHLAGDHLLRQLSATLLAQTRKSDLLARLGGDEFGILLEGCPPERALEIAQKLVDTVGAFRFEWEDKLFSVGVSIGMVIIDEQSGDLSEVLRAADTACYAAKEKGRNRVEVHARSTAPRSEAGRIDWARRLHEGAAQESFALFFQRVLRLDGQEGPDLVEVLLRYREDDGRMLLPMAFIPAAERHGLLPAIDRWVIRRLCSQPAEVIDRIGADALFAVNVSAAALAEEGFIDECEAAVRLAEFSPSRLCLEIAESAAVSHLHRTMQLIERLKPLGVRFSLDDFGGGLSSFGYLKRLPVDFLKIDGAIVKGVDRDLVDAEMVESIQRIASVMGIAVIAKCVESPAILRHLNEGGITFGQGFALHAPEALQLA